MLSNDNPYLCIYKKVLNELGEVAEDIYRINEAYRCKYLCSGFGLYLEQDKEDNFYQICPIYQPQEPRS